jgi:threonine dehydrogenase-like Zn-dependent dehydrogenase
MKALTWHGRRDVRVDTVPDPTVEQATDAIIRVTSTGLCGSDLHLYEVLGPFMEEGDVLGHEPMGIVEAVGAEVGDLQVGDRVVVPFNISCGHCFMCEHGLQSQCETTQVREQGMGAALFGYTKLYGEVPGGQAELLRVPQAHYGPIKVPEGPPDEPLPLPLRRPADRVAGGPLRADPRRRERRGHRPRTDRRDGLPDRSAPRRGYGHRARSRP